MNISFGQTYLIKSDNIQTLRSLRDAATDMPGNRLIVDNNKLLYIPREDARVMDNVINTLVSETCVSGQAKEWESLKSCYEVQAFNSMVENSIKIDLNA